MISNPRIVIDKIVQVAPRWDLMFSGDSSEATIITDRIRDRIAGIQELRFADVRQVASDVYVGRLTEILDRELIVRGHTRESASKSSEVLVEIQSAMPDRCDLMLSGIDEAGELHLAALFAPTGQLKILDVHGFSVIGIATPIAMNSLYETSQAPDSSLSQTLWNVLIAKFRSERSDVIGKQTKVQVRHSQGLLAIPEEVIQRAKNQWLELKSEEQRIPDVLRAFDSR
jgi:hypothetical protein